MNLAAKSISRRILRKSHNWKEALANVQLEEEITSRSLKKVLSKRGLEGRTFALFRGLRDRAVYSQAEIVEIIEKQSDFEQKRIFNGLTNNLKVTDWSTFKESCHDIYDEVKNLDVDQTSKLDCTIIDKNGKVKICRLPDYIPQLSKVDTSLFAVSICTVDGQRMHLGDSDIYYTMQSTSKPYTYGITHAALDDVLHEYVGHEPSGQAFNKIILDNDGRPYNPMINMGAIMTCSLVHHQQPLSHRFNYFLENYKKLTGSRSTLSCNMPVYKSELEVGFMNKAAVNYMMTKDCWKGMIQTEDQLLKNLDLYYQLCSIEVTTEIQSIMSACLANRGINPLTGESVLPIRSVKRALSLMFTCGMYDYSGRFAFKYGVPAKSGVSGVTDVVIPGVLSMTIYSPWLSTHSSSSLLGLQFIDGFIKKFPYHVFDSKEFL